MRNNISVQPRGSQTKVMRIITKLDYPDTQYTVTKAHEKCAMVLVISTLLRVGDAEAERSKRVAGIRVSSAR